LLRKLEIVLQEWDPHLRCDIALDQRVMDENVTGLHRFDRAVWLCDAGPRSPDRRAAPSRTAIGLAALTRPMLIEMRPLHHVPG
jgi:hypothetical protein